MKIENVDLETVEVLALELHRERARFLQTLVDLRKQSSLTQSDVAERIGVTQPTVAEFEHYDANPRLDTILRYALAINAHLNLRAYIESHT
ncbi:helix-turn-helix transcriptional regulator [Schaalia sp. ZJ1691]|uniref:helix-turn-helix domain-containing protein n=1 Tax=Schaalia sp. ZJ1691 TaxID=2709404 RepID=UPI0013EB05A7|nr:helix-turn-helix transcriptional regulator [Schaalia sp. ZJ1691]